MAIDARALVEPSVAEGRVNAQHNVVLCAVCQIVSQVEPKRRVSIIVAADEAAVDKHKHVAKRAIEFNRDAPPKVAGRIVELAAIPTHARLRIAPSQWLEAMRILCVI